jgi:nucleoside-diphosphate-sugar epimerase
MEIFVTGASGYVGQGVVEELLGAGHTVTGLARSDAGAARVAALGARPVRGSLDDPDTVAAYAAEADGVAHLAFDHENIAAAGPAGPADLAVIEAIGAALAGSDRPFLTTTGTALLVGTAPVATEDVAVDLASSHGGMRGASEVATLALAERGVRSAVVRLSPTTHSDADSHGFLTTLMKGAQEAGFAAYVGDGSNVWPAVHRSDAARLYRLGLESAPAGSRLHAVGEEGVPFLAIAEAIGRMLSVPVKEIGAEEALERFGFVGRFVSAHNPASSALTRELLGWEPTGPTVLEDIDGGAYRAFV